MTKIKNEEFIFWWIDNDVFQIFSDLVNAYANNNTNNVIKSEINKMIVNPKLVLLVLEGKHYL